MTAPALTPPAPPALSRGVLLRVCLRSLFLQASWNPQGMQNLGLAYAIYPALERLYPEKKALEEAVRRHLVFFNTHPYVAAAIVGGVLHHEQRVARGEESPDKVVAFKAALMGPLAALGDGFFWLSLKPATGAVSAALVPLVGVWAVGLFLLLYNGVHFTLRARLYLLGLMLGDRLVEAVARVNLPGRGAKLRMVGAACAGGLAAWLAVTFGLRAGGWSTPLLSVGCLGLGALSYVLVARRVPGYVVLYVAAVLACGAGAFL